MSVTVDQFLAAMTASGILSPTEIEQLAAAVPPQKRMGNAEEFARELVRQGKLTRYQAAAIYQDKADGLVLGNYVLIDKLGAGGMGQVFRARHRRMDRIVALKVLPHKAVSSPTAVARFQREVKAAARLTHPNIVTAHDADEAAGQHFLVMEYVEGSDLAQLVKSQGPLPATQALDFILQAARGLEHAHSEGIIHRDIKPSNLLVDKRGTIKILDMGLALVSDPLADPSAPAGAGLTQSGSIMGTIDYMAPEQAMDCREADARSDIYSLGCTLHFLLTGRPPYGGDTVLKRLTAHQQAAIPLLSSSRQDIPPGMQEVFSKVMAKRPSSRYQTAGELVASLESLRNRPTAPQPAAPQPAPVPLTAQPVAVRPIVAAPLTPPPSSISQLSGIASAAVARSPRKTRRPRTPVIAASLALLVAAVGTVAWVVANHPSGPAETAARSPSAAVSEAASSPSASGAATASKAESADPPQAVAASEKAELQPSPSPPKAEEPTRAAMEPAAPAAAALVAPSSKAAAPASVKPPPEMAAAAPPATPPAEADGKLPLPNDESQHEALKLIKQLYKDDYAAAKSPEAKAALAEKLLKQAQESRDDAGSLYALLDEARELAVAAVDPALAEKAIGMLAGNFAVEPLQLLAASLDEMVGKSHSAETNRRIVDAALARVEEAVAAQQFETGKQLADTALAAARKLRDAALTRRAVEMGKGVSTSKQQWDAWKKALATLAESPDDPAANQAAGRYLAFVQGKWDEGFAHLAKGPDGALKELASKALRPPTEPAALAVMADAWFAAAEKAKGKDKADLRAGAAYWYSLAEPGLTGLAKTIVEKRLKELGGKAAATEPRKIASRTPQDTAPLDVLKLIDLNRDVVFGSGWKLEPGMLVLPDPPAKGPAPRLMLPSPPGPDYALHLQLHPAGKSCGLFLGLLIGSARCGLYCEPAYTALGMVDGIHPNSSPTKSKPIWDGEKPVELVCEVRGGEISVQANGQPILSWTGDPQRLSMHGSWNVPNRTALVLGPRAGICEVTRLELAAISAGAPAKTDQPGSRIAAGAGARNRPLAFNQAEHERNVAKWVLSIGGKVKVVPPEQAATATNPPATADIDQLPSEPLVVWGIDLMGNKQVTDKDMERLPGLMGINELMLSKTEIGDAGLASIGRLPTLKVLFLHVTKVTDAGLPALDSLGGLTHLFLPTTNTSDAGFVHLRGLTQLRHLGLQNTGLTDAGIQNFAALPELRWLAISGTKITDDALKQLTRCSQLTYVEVVDTKISDAGLLNARQMPALTGMNLDGTAVDDRGLEFLSTLPNFAELHLARTKVTDAGLQRFQLARPNCKVVR